MDARFYNSEQIDIERLARDLVNVYQAQGYQAQDIGNKDQMMVQVKKGGDFEAIIGMQAALTLNIQRTSGGVLAMIGQQRWIDKAAVGAVGIAAAALMLWPLAITAGVGALRQASLGNQILNVVDGLVRQQRPEVQVGPVPYHLMPQVQQQWAPPSSASNPPSTPYYTPPSQPAPAPMRGPAPLRCSSCNTPYEPGDTFCTGCGRSLMQPHKYCSRCNFELKPDIAFCPKCGSSTFQATSAAQTQAGPQTPPVQSAPSITYKPPVQPSQPPTYTPPVAKAPEVPYYTPPAQPPTPIYQPKPPTVDPHAMPTMPAETVQPAKVEKPAEPYYVPPQPQTPSVVPQPKVTFVPDTRKKEAPAPQQQQPQKVYYTPSNQAQKDALSQQSTPTEATLAQTVQAQPAADATDKPWAVVVLSNGEQIQLKGVSAIVGRYDHDMGGVQPEIDLAKVQGADTVSRVHASLEYSNGSILLTDLNSTNATRINGNRLTPDTPTPINDGDTLQFGSVSCTLKKL